MAVLLLEFRLDPAERRQATERALGMDAEASSSGSRRRRGSWCRDGRIARRARPAWTGGRGVADRRDAASQYHRRDSAGRPGLHLGSGEAPGRLAAALRRQPSSSSVHGGGADRSARPGAAARRIHHERPRLGAAEAAVERDQLLERAALVELRVVEAADHDVGHVREAVGAQQVLRRRSVRRPRADPPPRRARRCRWWARVGRAPRRRARPSARAASRCAGARAAPGSAAGGARSISSSVSRRGSSIR